MHRSGTVYEKLMNQTVLAEFFNPALDRELKAIIENSENLAEFNDGILALVERWQVPVGVIPDLILE